jgi:hypothetical protein
MVTMTSQTLDSSKYIASSAASLARPGAGRQLQLLIQRAFVSYWRDTRYNLTRLTITVFWYLFLGGIFRGLQRNDYGSLQVWCRDILC